MMVSYCMLMMIVMRESETMRVKVRVMIRVKFLMIKSDVFFVDLVMITLKVTMRVRVSTKRVIIRDYVF